MPTQPFWTSKSFWTATVALGLAIAVKKGWIDASTDTVLWGGMILAVLAGIFRWTADRPLSLRGQPKFKK